MQRSELSGTVLQLKAMGIDNIMRFEWLAPPPAETMIRALELLHALGALNSDARQQLLTVLPTVPLFAVIMYCCHRLCMVVCQLGAGRFEGCTHLTTGLKRPASPAVTDLTSSHMFWSMMSSCAYCQNGRQSTEAKLHPSALVFDVAAGPGIPMQAMSICQRPRLIHNLGFNLT